MEDMPILYENIELSATPQAIDDIEEISQPKTEKSAPTETIEEKTAIVKRNFFKRLWSWMNSPLNVKWKDIN